MIFCCDFLLLCFVVFVAGWGGRSNANVVIFLLVLVLALVVFFLVVFFLVVFFLVVVVSVSGRKEPHRRK